ncbi:hypothetical protein CALVIDRAFT_559650 [Calocera viscosa TUFC12733]|uniref:F-box domain-containing protein n=1 Tax=Calocera viscosa (strain TUFC12733) TaxID=1330018 RepID=A0A167SF87_CALVF|nr:hypothetical protein CALVIDRAFT_559650 [Calocera viscosa TUFC12733]
MKTLRNVTISASVFEEKHHHMIPLDVRQLAVLIVQSNHTLRDIRIKIEREDKYTFSDFAPLYECGGLRHLELGIGGEFEDIEDVHFQQMAQSWPDLHFLAIVTEIWRDDYSVDLDQIDPAELTSVSLDVLQFFLHHCPKLNNLRLTCIGAPHTSYPTVPIQVDSGHGPLCLDLGGLSEEVAESAAVARFLYALYQDREIRFLGKTAYAKDVQKVLDHQRESQRDLQGDSIDDVPESG